MLTVILCCLKFLQEIIFLFIYFFQRQAWVQWCRVTFRSAPLELIRIHSDLWTFHKGGWFPCWGLELSSYSWRILLTIKPPIVTDVQGLKLRKWNWNACRWSPASFRLLINTGLSFDFIYFKLGFYDVYFTLGPGNQPCQLVRSRE